jgi:hypothetical protein
LPGDRKARAGEQEDWKRAISNRSWLHVENQKQQGQNNWA